MYEFKSIEDKQKFYIQDDNIVVYFDLYDIAPYAAGIPEFKIANLFEDMGTLKKVQKIAMEIMADDPLLEKEKNIKLNELVKEKFSSRIEI